MGQRAAPGDFVLLDQSIDQEKPVQHVYEHQQNLQFEEFAGGIADHQMIQFNGNMQQDICGSNSSTQDTSEGVMSANHSYIESIPENIQNKMQLLTQEEVQILYRLDFYCFDQAGCRKLQHMIQDIDTNGMPPSPHKKAFLDCLIHFMLPLASDVMINQFGNYLCQRIMEVADPASVESLVTHIQNDIVQISLNIHGTRVIQILIERLAKGILEGVHSQLHIVKRPNNFNKKFEDMDGFEFSTMHRLYDSILMNVIAKLTE
jgi:hypothetical protein